MPELVFYRRGEEVLRFAVDKPRVVLGRGEQADVVLPDAEISRAQVAVILEGDTARAEDLSGKGTVIGGERTQAAPLHDGTDITLGPWRAIYRQRSGGESGTSTLVREAQTELQSVPGREEHASAQLRLRVGHAKETVHRLLGDSVTLGKDEGNDLVVDDKFVSGKHLRFTRRGKSFQVVDLGSTNGTFVGALRIHDVEAPLGTSFRAGTCEVTLEPQAATKKDGATFEGIIGADPSVQQLAELITRVAPSNAAVTILGESGTGKELVAHALHARSNRASQPFIPVNCAAISKELIESELFGHEKGSFTGAQTTRKGAFEEADGGTLFLDEIGELPLELQAKLLRALESGEIKRVGASRPLNVDVRIVAATNRDLLAQAREGKFREDLYYRLCVVPLHLAPLRNRRGDIPALAEHFVARFSPRGQQVKLSPASLERLQGYAWPGNIRELRNVVHRALLLRKGLVVEPHELSFDGPPASATSGGAEPGEGFISELPAGLTLEQMLERAERQIVEAALRKYQNNRERVAKELGVARSTLFKRLKDWGLTVRSDEAE